MVIKEDGVGVCLGVGGRGGRVETVPILFN